MRDQERIKSAKQLASECHKVEGYSYPSGHSAKGRVGSGDWRTSRKSKGQQAFAKSGSGYARPIGGYVDPSTVSVAKTVGEVKASMKRDEQGMSERKKLRRYEQLILSGALSGTAKVQALKTVEDICRAIGRVPFSD